MSITDRFLTSAIEYLQKIQKSRKRKPKKKVKKASPKISRRVGRPQVKKKIPRKVNSTKKIPKKGVKKFSTPSKKKPLKSSAKVKKPMGKTKKASPKVSKKKVTSSKKKISKVKKVSKVAGKASGKKKASREILIGEVTHFFSKIQVIVLKMTGGSLKVGDQIHVKGRGCDFVQKVDSLQIESVDVKLARKGQLVGLKVDISTKVGSKVFRLMK